MNISGLVCPVTKLPLTKISDGVLTTTDGKIGYPLDEEMAGLGMAAFREAPLFERLALVFQHAGAAAQHDAISLDVQRRWADVVEQLLRRDEVGDVSRGRFPLRQTDSRRDMV